MLGIHLLYQLVKLRKIFLIMLKAIPVDLVTVLACHFLVVLIELLQIIELISLNVSRAPPICLEVTLLQLLRRDLLHDRPNLLLLLNLFFINFWFVHLARLFLNLSCFLLVLSTILILSFPVQIENLLNTQILNV